MWKEFNLAMVGGLAGLVGLLIVAMSVNITAILKAPHLPARAAAREREVSRVSRSAKAVMLLLRPAAYAIGAAMLILGSTAGLAWFAAGAILSVISGVTFAWIVLIEILR